jgi:hypothetical protein
MRAGQKDSDSGPAQLRFSDRPSTPGEYASLAGSTEPARIITRPSIALSASYKEVSKAYIEAVHSVLVGRMKASDAAAELEKQLIQITGFNTGPPRKTEKGAP